MSTITDLCCEYRVAPLGLDVSAPRLGWRMNTTRAGARQTAYRIAAASAPDKLAAADLWDSGKIDSDLSVHVIYTGQKLTSRQRVYWKVAVWDDTGAMAESDVTFFEMGLLKRSDWKAKWIGAELRGGPRSQIPAPYVRKSFKIQSPITSARLYITALGLYDCTINGEHISPDIFAPGWTDYNKRIQYNTYDVTALLKSGENVIGAILGDGWAVGRLGWTGSRQHYVDRPRLLAQLEVTHADGRTQVITSDRTWMQQFGALLDNDMQAGEAYDARLEFPGWDSAGFDDKHWQPVATFEASSAMLVATNGPTVRRIEEIKPVSDPAVTRGFLATTAIYDLGQNMVGRVRFRGSAPTGTTVSIRHAEMLDAKGALYTANLRSARATDYYTFKGEGEEVWEPRFTFHGFRYVEIAGYSGEFKRDTVTGIVLHSDMAVTGSFECSDPLINQLQHNIVWGQKGNFVDVPTDCPQRDERLGWTGDIQVFAQTAALNMDVAGFLAKWLRDVGDAQSGRGEIPAVVPNKPPLMADSGPAWSDAAVIVPWTLYQAYGDSRMLSDSYATMSRFMDYLQEVSPKLIRCALDHQGWPGFGDWLSINANTPRDLIGTAFLAHDARLMAQVAAALGKRNDAAKYRKLFADVKQAFADRFLVGGSGIPADEVPSEFRKQMDARAMEAGTLKLVDYGAVDSKVFNLNVLTPTQTSYVLALHFDLLPKKLRAVAAAELVEDIKLRGMHLSTGFVGAPYLAHALSSNGHVDTAYELLQQKTWPSWLYSVTKGATTIWERWDGYTDDNGFQDPGMNSFNHYAYGSIGSWLYGVVAGIEADQEQPGYKHSILRPQPGGGLTHAAGVLQTQYGELRSSWSIADGAFTWTVVVPPNTTATAHVPKADGKAIMLNGAAVSGAEHELVAGEYTFVVA
jgi:alpha-L-rhamnosidase